MSFYFISLILLEIFVFVSGVFTYVRYKKSSGIYYLLFSIVIPLWFILYFLSFNSDFGSDVVMRIYRLQYSLSIIGFYSILFFILFYGNKYVSKKNIHIGVNIFFICILCISNLTPLIVKDVIFNKNLGSYIEVFGPLYNSFVLLYVLILPLFLYISYQKIRKLYNIDKVRLIHIVSGFSVFVGISLTFLVFIPFAYSDANLLYFEKLTPFFILPFILGVLYSNYKYDFTDYRWYLSSVILYSFSIISSIILILLTRYLLFSFGDDFIVFWGISQNMNIFDIILAIVFFIIIFNTGKKYVYYDNFEKNISLIQDKVPFLTRIESLNVFLEEEFLETFGIQNVNISLSDTNDSILEFFSSNIEISYIINDYIFIQKNKHRNNIGNITREIQDSQNIIFPLYGKGQNVSGVLNIGRKQFGDAYSSNEIRVLKKFSDYLQGHIKYLSIYRKLEDLSINLDKKVDEKTIEYNDLLSKQKEFIAFVGHEIKNPITNSLFLCDSLNDDIGELKESKVSSRLRDDGRLLYSELVKVSDLVKHIFSTEQFDLEKIRLYKKDQDINIFLNSEIGVFKQTFPHICFDTDIKKLGLLSIDTTQMRQVIHNLLNNAVKFADRKKPIIRITAHKYQDAKISVTIEDNGDGLSDVDTQVIFEKYTTGGSGSIGLGMGLYLCKKIVELHGGKIQASPSSILGGVKFTIHL